MHEPSPHARPRPRRLLLAAIVVLSMAAACSDTPDDRSPPPEGPDLTILRPVDETTVTASPIQVSGIVTDPEGVETVSVIVNGADRSSCDVRASGFWCSDVELDPGSNRISVRAVDVTGAESTDEVVVTLDLSAPGVAITSPPDGSTVASDTITVAGTLGHPDPITSVTAHSNGASVDCSFSQTTFDCSSVPVPSGLGAITVEATDVDGVTGSDSVHVYRTSPSDFEITLRFFDDDEFTPSQREAFTDAANVWGRIITNDLEDTPLDLAPGEACTQLVDDSPAIDETVDDLMILVRSFSQAEGGVLGVASPCLTRNRGTDTGTNVLGFMEFDVLDLDALEDADQLVDTIVHEMGHVLGIGTNWEGIGFDLLAYEASDGGTCVGAPSFTQLPRYIGDGGRAGYDLVGGSGDVPVEEDYGIGTMCGHWDEETFGNELMTGFLDAGENPLSVMTILSLTDIGFEVDTSHRDPYGVPALRRAAPEDAFPIGAREILGRAEAGVDPATGTITPLPGPSPER